jgi:hypothetical protein
MMMMKMMTTMSLQQHYLSYQKPQEDERLLQTLYWIQTGKLLFWSSKEDELLLKVHEGKKCWRERLQTPCGPSKEESWWGWSPSSSRYMCLERERATGWFQPFVVVVDISAQQFLPERTLNSCAQMTAPTKQKTQTHVRLQLTEKCQCPRIQEKRPNRTVCRWSLLLVDYSRDSSVRNSQVASVKKKKKNCPLTPFLVAWLEGAECWEGGGTQRVVVGSRVY